MELKIRRSLRKLDELRAVEIIPNFLSSAEGSCLIKFGNTHVICTASLDTSVPHFIKNTGKGWVTAEYGMLPRSTHSRMQREATRGKQDGRTQEIQRLIGRSLRAITQLDKMGERQIIVDCDVIQADGGTRTAAITGGYVALVLAMQKLKQGGILKSLPIVDSVAAISCGIVEGQPMLDLEYMEDSNAEVDANFIFAGSSNLIEVQATGEKRSYTKAEYDALYELALQGAKILFELQRKAIG